MNVPALAQGVFFQRLAIATLLGFAIGLERQWRQRSAGLHTSTLVAVGAALFTSMPELAGSTDVMRVAGQVVTGVGFLAGGVILREGFNIRGLITAATLWSTAAVGVLAGAGFVQAAAVGAALILVTNLVCMPLASLMSRIPRAAGEYLATTYTVRVGCAERARSAVRECVLHEIRVTSLTLTSMVSTDPSDAGLEIVIEMTKPGSDDDILKSMIAAISRIDGVTSTRWEAAEKSA